MKIILIQLIIEYIFKEFLIKIVSLRQYDFDEDEENLRKVIGS
jgi:hypothetical protein